MALSGDLFQSKWNPANQDVQNTGSSTFNPSLPAFQPNGTEMTRFQQPRTTNIPGTHEIQRYLIDMNVAHQGDMVRVSRQTIRNTEAIHELEAKLKHDLRFLHGQIQQRRDSAHDSISPSPNYTTDQDFSPSRKMLNDFSTDEIAKAYLQEAEHKEEEAAIQEQIAVQLRKQAELITGVSTQKQLPAPAEPEHPAPPKPGSKVIGFACCELAYGSVHELLVHVEQAHGRDLNLPQTRGSAIPGTPTHAPAPRPGRTEPRSRAIEIKRPEAAPSEDVKVESAVAEETPLPQAPAVAPATPNATWTPFAVRQMPSIEVNLPENEEIFSFDFIRANLGGGQWSPSFYFESGKSIFPFKAYWILGADDEPFLPTSPGQHGAKLTPFFNETPSTEAPDPEDYLNTPVFIVEKGTTNRLRYYGNYSQIRYSDKLSYDDIMDHVSEDTRRYWADQLTSVVRPPWVTEALMKQFWPRPTYEGPTPTDSALNTPATIGTADNSSTVIERRVTRALNEYAEELKEWEKDTRLRANLLTSDNLFEAFKNPDSDTEPGLRLWWEYLTCVNYDVGFYEMLCKIKNNPAMANRGGGKKRSAAPAEGKIVPGDEVEDLTLDPVHPPPQNPKKLQVEQWKGVDVKKAEEEAKKPTKFVVPKFDSPSPKSKGKAPANYGGKTRGHVAGKKPWETEKTAAADSWGTEKKDGEKGGAAANSWQGGGDLKAAKEFNKQMQTSKPSKPGKTATRRPPHMKGK